MTWRRSRGYRETARGGGPEGRPSPRVGAHACWNSHRDGAGRGGLVPYRRPVTPPCYGGADWQGPRGALWASSADRCGCQGGVGSRNSCWTSSRRAWGGAGAATAYPAAAGVGGVGPAAAAFGGPLRRAGKHLPAQAAASGTWGRAADAVAASGTRIATVLAGRACCGLGCSEGRGRCGTRRGWAVQGGRGGDYLECASLFCIGGLATSCENPPLAITA